MATASATSTTEMPAADTARMNSMSKNINPANEIATMSAEKITVRPARSTVRSVASWRSSIVRFRRPDSRRIARSSSRNRETTNRP